MQAAEITVVITEKNAHNCLCHLCQGWSIDRQAVQTHAGSSGLATCRLFHDASQSVVIELSPRALSQIEGGSGECPRGYRTSIRWVSTQQSPSGSLLTSPAGLLDRLDAWSRKRCAGT